jgi:aldose 1-epimerase
MQAPHFVNLTRHWRLPLIKAANARRIPRTYGIWTASQKSQSTDAAQPSLTKSKHHVMSKAFKFLPLGAIIQEFNVNGVNIVQGFKTAEQYKQYNGPYFGETIGRIANRVAEGKFELNGKTHQLPVNNGPNSLHGGDKGWGKCEFEGPVNVERNGEDAVLFKYLSKDGEEGYPGTVQVSVWYVQKKEQVNGAQQEVLYIEYEAELVGDEVEETAINMTNHRYVLQKS